MSFNNKVLPIQSIMTDNKSYTGDDIVRTQSASGLLSTQSINVADSSRRELSDKEDCSNGKVHDYRKYSVISNDIKRQTSSIDNVSVNFSPGLNKYYNDEPSSPCMLYKDVSVDLWLVSFML